MSGEYITDTYMGDEATVTSTKGDTSFTTREQRRAKAREVARGHVEKRGVLQDSIKNNRRKRKQERQNRKARRR